MWFDTITQACTTPTGESVGGAVGGGDGRNLAPALLSNQVSILTSLLKRMVRDMTDLAQVRHPYDCYSVLIGVASLCRRGLAQAS